MKAVILAAGKGTRLMPLTDSVPKAMVLLHGKPLLEHVLLSLKKAGIKEAVVIVGYLKEKILEFFGNDFSGIQIEYIEQKELLGTGNAVLQAKKAVGKQDFLVGFADTIGNPLIWKTLIEKKGFDAVVTVREEKEPGKFGVVEMKGKKLLGVEEKPVEPKSKFVLAGFYRFSPAVFNAIENSEKTSRGEIELTDAINFFAKKNLAVAVECNGRIFDIGSLNDLKEAEQEVSFKN